MVGDLLIRTRCLGLVVVAGVLLTGCGPATTAPTTPVEPSLGTISVITSPEQVVFPINSYLPSADQTAAIMLTGLGLMNSCVQTDGEAGQIDFLMLDPSGGEQTAGQADLIDYIESYRKDDVMRNAMWQFFDPTNAAQYGYHRPASEWSGLSVSAVLSDPVQNSCFARVNSVIPGGQMLSPFMVSDLPDSGSQWEPQDSRFVAVEKQWSDCMAGKGFSYTTPNEAMAANFSPNTPTPTSQEQAVAVADVQCKISTNLVGIAVAIQSAYDQQYIDSHRDQLAAQQTQIVDFLAGRVIVPEAEPTATPSAAHS